MKKVIVMLSSYNGENYISQQIDSIIAQSFENWSLYIRDDGSKDDTRSILKKYERLDRRIQIIDDGANLGYPACFYALTNLELDADYFMFCDQDDVWLPNKIEHAVTALDAADPSVPTAYYAGYYICDSDLKIQRESSHRRNTIRFKDTLFDVCGLEFTMAINAPAMRLIRKYQPQKSEARGTWMSMLFSALGVICYHNEPCAYYRRHGSSVTNQNMGFIGTWCWRCKTFLGNGGSGLQEYNMILEDFREVMKHELHPDQLKTLRLFLSKKRLKKFFYPHRLRNSLTDEVGLRLLFLLNKL